MGGPRAAIVLAALCTFLFAPAGEGSEVAGPDERFASLPGWADDAHEEAFAVFRASCPRVLAHGGGPGGGLAPSPALRQVCASALAGPAVLDRAAARAFFERNFRPVRLRPSGLLTGYFEPEYEATLVPEGPFQTPVLARPDDLVPLAPSEAVGSLAGLVAARRRADGTLVPYHDRAAIEDGALAGRGLELCYLAVPFDLFLAQIQGSFRVRLPDGRVWRLGYAARNGYPFSPISRVLLARGLITPPVDLPAIRAALSTDPDMAREVMRLNRSYVFFRRLDDLSPDAGPVGAQGLSLTPGRSIAVDRMRHAYGTPFFLVADGAGADGTPLRRLTIAQDTGSAIVGPARIDYFTGPGATAGEYAGRLHHPAQVIVLRPLARPAP